MGCQHYHSELDIVSIQFKCCGDYFPCYYCHLEEADHCIKRWEPEEFDQPALLCGSCQNTLTIHQYFSCNHTCFHCSAPFNPGCEQHRNLYFAV